MALVGYYFFPLAPPRLMNGGHFVDTVMVDQTWGSMASGDLKHMSNQYAAMPSMHIGWSLWCGVVIFALAPKWWMKALGLLHPFFTVSAIVATGNHWILDAAGGAAVVAAGFGLADVFQGPRARSRPQPVRTSEELESAAAG